MGWSVGEEVGEDGALGEEAQLLVDDADAPAPGVGRGREADRLAGDADLAGVRLDGPGEDLHQRGLAGAVLADDGVDVAGLDGEIHADEGVDAAVGLAQTGDGDRRGRSPSPADPMVMARLLPMPGLLGLVRDGLDVARPVRDLAVHEGLVVGRGPRPARLPALRARRR